MQNGVAIYRSESYSAYIYQKSIVICTKYQAFRISYKARSSRVFLDELALDIMDGKIGTLCDLKDFNGELRWNHTSIPSMLP